MEKKDEGVSNLATETKTRTVKKKEEIESPRAFAQDMGTTFRKHWKFFLGFILGVLVAYWIF